MRRRATLPKEDEEKARRIFRAVGDLDRRRSAPGMSSFVVAVVILGLILAVIVLYLLNQEKFAQIWNHLMRPDSVPGMNQ
jgi:type VI protein secretion system component VasF